MEGISLFLAGSCFYSSCFVIVRKILTFFTKEIFTTADITTIAVKLVSSIQAAITVIAGWIIAGKCESDIIHAQYWLTNAYAWFGLPYFYYDTVGMYLEYWHNHPDIQDKKLTASVKHFIMTNKAILIHHIILPTIFFPLLVVYRHGIGDFIVGTFYQIELSVPFIAFRNILVQLKMKDTVLYVVAGVALIVVFTITRVLVFPYLYWRYSLYSGIPLWNVPFMLPVICNTGCLVLLSLQIYWLYKMVKAACRLIVKIYNKQIKSKQFSD